MDIKAEKRMDRLEKIIEVGFTQVNGEIKRLDERIGHVEKRMEDAQSSLEKKIEDTRFSLEKRIDVTNQRIDDTKSSLEKQVEANNARLNSITIGFFGIVGILVTGMLTIVGKVVFFPNSLS
ncbi:MAG: DUF4164 domain-containing protein [Cyanobacteria bacterium SBLK]|nr:DUF4164 domain-containing protein [Cyanobacteria bacterium SBLK]